MKTHPIIKLAELVPNALLIGKRAVSSALFPYGNKPLIGHLLDRLVNQGHQQVTIALSDSHPEITEKLIKKTHYDQRWGIEINIVKTDDDREISKLLMTLYQQDINKLAIFETNKLMDIESPHFYLSINDEKSIRSALSIKLKHSNINAYLSNYHNDNIQLLNTINHYQINEFELGNDVYIGNGVNCKNLCKSSNIQAAGNSLILGKNSFLDGSAVIVGSICIGKSSFVDTGVTLDNTIILPNVYVGKNVNLSNCIAGAGWVFNAHTKGYIEISDKRLLSAA